MKPFLIYTGLRIALFLACWSAFIAVGALIADDTQQVVIWSLIAAGVVSSILSLRLLDGPRERLAQSVQERAERAKTRFEEMKTAEDRDEV